MTAKYSQGNANLPVREFVVLRTRGNDGAAVTVGISDSPRPSKPPMYRGKTVPVPSRLR